MIRQYIDAAMARAKFDNLEDDGSCYGEIPDFQGVYANADTLEECRKELEEVLEEWILIKISRNLPLPIMDGIEIKIKEVA